MDPLSPVLDWLTRDVWVVATFLAGMATGCALSLGGLKGRVELIDAQTRRLGRENSVILNALVRQKILGWSELD